MKNHIRLKAASRRAHAFSLVEIMVSLAVLTILLLISAQVIGQVQATWSASNARVSQFKEARTAFDILSRNISQATLNTYIDYDNNYLKAVSGGTAAATAPSSYVRQSELQFRCGSSAALIPGAGGGSMTPGHAVFFQAPLGISNDPTLVGLDRLLCARGYFVQYSSDEKWVPKFILANEYKYRYRLMEFSPPTELNSIYAAARTPAGKIAATWFESAGAQIPPTANGVAALPTTRPVADNIIALIVSPRREADNNQEGEAADGPTEIAPQYNFDSSDPPPGREAERHLLPPMVKIVLIAIDEKSATRLEELTGGDTSTPPLGEIKLTNAAQLDAEVKVIVKMLQDQKLNYRVFTATVPLRGSKWST